MALGEFPEKLNGAEATLVLEPLVFSTHTVTTYCVVEVNDRVKSVKSALQDLYLKIT